MGDRSTQFTDSALSLGALKREIPSNVSVFRRSAEPEKLEGRTWGWGGLGVAAHDVRRLESFGTFEEFELHNFAFIERAITIFLDHGEMDEHVLACGALDETVSLGSVKPLHCTLLFIHENSFRLRIKSLPRMVPRLVVPDSIEVSSSNRESGS